MHYITEQLTFSTWLSQHGRVVETHLFKFLFHFSDGMLDATHLHGARVVHTKSIGGKGGGGGGGRSDVYRMAVGYSVTGLGPSMFKPYP